MSIIFAILIFSLLIFVHELGHFLAAKASGVRVNEFSMFMGPAIFKKQKGETLYAIRCIPIGGYCAMEGEDSDTDDPHSFQKAAWWKRLIILAAGSFMNLVAGLLLFAICFLPAKQIAMPQVSQMENCCIFQGENGLLPGDTILEIDGEKVYVNSDISLLLSLNKTGTHDIVIERAGEKITYKNLPMIHDCQDEEGNHIRHYGFGFGVAKEATLGLKLQQAGLLAVDNVRNVRLSIQMLITGQASFKDMSGPVGIVSTMNDVANQSETWVDALINMVYIGGIIAVNLAVMNLLPIPALDGGRIVALLLTTGIQAITKKKIDPKYEGYIHAAGMILLLILMAVIMFKDIFVIFKR